MRYVAEGVGHPSNVRFEMLPFRGEIATLLCRRHF